MDINTRLPSWFWISAALGGVGLLGLGLVLVVFPFVFPASLDAFSVVVVGYGLIGAFLGISLIVAGSRGWRQIPGRRFCSPRSWWIFLLLSVLFGIAGLLLPPELQIKPLFGPFHSALIVLPGLFLFSLLSLAAGTEAALSFRRLVLMLSGGASSVFLAIPAEILGLLISAVASVGVALLLPRGAAEVETLLSLFQRWAERPPTDEAEFLAVLTSPVVLMTLALTLGIAAPLIEEFVKTLVMGVVGIWVRPAVRASFVWGAACGLGFAWLEGVSNGAMGLGGLGGWIATVTTRFLATAMHMLTGGLVGMGWGWYWQGRRWRLLLAYGGAVIVHGAWNLNLVLSLGGLSLSSTAPLASGAVLVAGVLFQLTLILISLVGVVGIPFLLRRRGTA